MGEAQTNASTFGALLRSLREDAGITQEELAERAGLSRDAVSALERGRRSNPHPQTIRLLCDALGLSDDDARMLRDAVSKRALIEPPTAPPQAHFVGPPTPSTSLIGRQQELADVQALVLGPARLVTLTGPGGVGKTRLATQLAVDLGPAFSGAVAYVPLESVHDSTVLLCTIAEAVGIRDLGEGRPGERLFQALRDQRMLLVLDNLEQLSSAFSTIGELVATCPEVRIVATSRIPLRLSAEHEYPVQPLPLPETSRSATISELTGNDAVTLFVLRAQAARPSFALTGANAPAVASICATLDGLPLAIELAAARIRILTPEAMLGRLTSRLDLLAGGPRDAAPRLQSIRATIDWSYSLLEDGERRLFRALSIFADSFTLAAAEGVLAAQGNVQVLDGLASLVDKSLIRTIDTGEADPRFAMLATIRDYGRERLAETGETERVRSAHAAWYLGLAEQGHEAFRQRRDHEQWLDRLERDRGNLREALAWFRESGDGESLARMAGFLYWFWDIRGPLNEGRVWLERALAVPADAIPVEVRFQVLLAAGQLAHFQGDDDQARIWSEAAYAAMPESVDPWVRATPIMLLGLIAEDAGDYQLAEVRFSDALRLFRDAGDPFNTALAVHHLGVTAWGMGDVVRAITLCESALGEQRRLRDTWHAANSLGYLGLIACQDGQFANAARFLRESLDIRWSSGASEDLASSIADFAVLASRTGRHDLSARLLGAAAGIRHDVKRHVINLPERAEFEQAEQETRAALGEAAFCQAFTDGERLSAREAVQMAVALADAVAAGRPL